jgi:uncharacterized protein
MAGRFEIFRSRDRYYFRLRAANRQIILASEGYATKAGAEEGVAAVKANAPDDASFERKQTPGGYSFVLKAANGESIGRSEVYTSSAWRDSGIESVKKHAPGATVDDQT